MISIEENVPLAPHTSFRIGGPARFFATVRTVEELREALAFSLRERIPFAILGGGSNLLVSDRGFRGVVIRLRPEGVEVSGNSVEVEAGVDLTALVKRTPEWGLSGIESLAGIPGLVGGAIRGNAGAYSRSIGEVCRTVYALHAETLELLALEREECRFRYRSSLFKEQHNLVVFSALLELTFADPEEIRSKVEGTLARRAARNLECERSVGSFFMNPVVTDQELVRRFESDQQVHCRECRIPAGWLIDKAGLRNTGVGGAMVSAQHANYLINSGGATADEILRLARLVKSRVLDSMGVELQEEVSCLGFGSLPDLGGSEKADRDRPPQNG